MIIIFSFRIHAIQAHGFMKKWFDTMFYDYANTNDTKIQSCIYDQLDLIDSINYIDLKSMRTCFYLFGCGIGFALFMFICEIIIKFFNHKENSVGEHQKWNRNLSHCSYNYYKTHYYYY